MEQNARLARRYGLKHAVDGDVLIVATLIETALVFERHIGKAVAPRAGFGES